MQNKTNLLKLMSERGISCRALARTLGVSPAAVSDWTRRVSYPQPTHRRSLAAYFGVPIEWLMADAT